MNKNCTQSVDYSLVKVEENKRKVVFRNKGRDSFDVTRLDGCLIQDGMRSDYLVSKRNVASVFVELKGSDVQHACEQLLASVQNESAAALCKNKVGFLVVCSKYPRFDTFVAKAKIACAKQYKGGFHVVCDQREFDIERVAAIDGPY